MRQVWPERLPLTVRLSCTDWVSGGWSVEEIGRVSAPVESRRGGPDRLLLGRQPAQSARPGRGELPGAAGRNHPPGRADPNRGGRADHRPTQADEILRNNRTDLVLLGRELLRDPYWPIHAAEALKQPAPIPAPYLRAF